METDHKLMSFTSLKQIEIDELLSVFGPLAEEKLRLKTLKGKCRNKPVFTEYSNSSLRGSAAKLDFLLTYLKENARQSLMGRLFGFSQPKVSEWFSFLLPVLEDSLRRLGVLPAFGQGFTVPDCLDYAICDVTERPVPRSPDTEVQKECYSGKKKTHTVKNLAFVDVEGYILYLGETFPGSVHDKKTWDEAAPEPCPVNILADSGFEGAEKDCPNVLTPFKKPKGKELSNLRKQINTAIGSARVTAEHAFSGVKRLRMAKEILRL